MITIDISGNAVQATDEYIARLQDVRPALAEAGAYLEGKAKDRFLKEQDPEGRPWAKLSPLTLARKRGSKFPSAILREQGILASSVAFRVSKTQVRVGSGIEYGAWHQTGTRNMPARPWLGFERDDPDTIAQFFADHLEGRL